MVQTGETALDLLRLGREIWQGKWKILLGLALGGVGSLVLTLLLYQPVYQSRVLFYVDGAQAQTAMVLLKTDETLGSVAAGTQWDRETVAELLTARVAGDSAYFQVTARCHSPEQARQAAEAVAQVLPRRVESVLPNVRLMVADVPTLPEKPAGPGRFSWILAGTLAGGLLPAAWLAGNAFFRTERKQKYGSWERR